MKKRNQRKQKKKKQEFVFVLDKGMARQTNVTSGIQDNDYLEIISGLKAGDVVICGPYSAVSKILRDKSKVKVVKKEDLYKTEK
jgi:HlyD family secretion protein